MISDYASGYQHGYYSGFSDALGLQEIMDGNLTTKKQDIFVQQWATLTKYFNRNPTLDEAREKMGFSKISSVQRHLYALEKKGIMARTKSNARNGWYVVQSKLKESK